jgi:hypothetical protein
VPGLLVHCAGNPAKMAVNSGALYCRSAARHDMARQKTKDKKDNGFVTVGRLGVLCPYTS